MTLKISRTTLVISLALLSYLFVAPRLGKIGRNIVIDTFHAGAARYVALEDPYKLPIPKGDRFEYSPFFAALYSPLTFLPEKVEVALWAFLNCLVFWWGVCLWVNLADIRRPLTVLGFLLCSMELNISVLYQQINALLTGMVLIGVYYTSGWLLAFATSIKIFPIVFLGTLVPKGKTKYIGAALAGIAITLLLPAVRGGLKHDYWLHQQWIERVYETMTVIRPHGLELEKVLHRFGLGGLGTILHWAVFLVTGFTAVFYPWRETKMYDLWTMFVISGILLFSPLTESPTFVLAAPTYVFLSSKHRHTDWLVLLVAAFLMTVSFTDLWPKALWNPTYPYKTLGLFLLWLLLGSHLLRSLRRSG